MLTLLLGKDWKANRSQILNRIAEDVRRERGGRILMVPELISHDTERRLSQIAGDTASRFAEVLSFTRLASRVADSVGHAAKECLDNGGRVVAMASAARQLHSVLKAYAAVETQPEFLRNLVDAVDEFKRCCVTSQALRDAAGMTEGSLAQKLEELSMLQDAYDGLCARGKKDPRDQMTWLLEQLKDSSFAEEHVFYIDGFPDFSRQHMEILEYLILVSPEVVISLNCDVPGSGKMAFQKAGRTALELRELGERLGIQVNIETVSPLPSPLEKILDQLFQGKIRKLASPEVLSVCRTETVSQECTAAAERVMALVSSGARYRDIAVVCGDIGTYGNTLNMAFQRCGIPLYLSGTEDILERSVILAVLAAMDAALGGFEQRDVIRYLKSMVSPLSLDICDKVENYGILWGIQGNKWLSQWENHPRGLGEDFTREDVLLLEELNEARKLALEPLARLRDGFRRAASLRDQVQALYSYMKDISLSSRLSTIAQQMDADGDNKSAQVLNQLWEILVNALEQLYDVLGDTVWDSDTFVRLIRLLLSQYDVGTIPTVLDSVTAGAVSAMRCQQVKHLVVLGALEGSIPGYGGASGVLSDQERAALRKLGVYLNEGSLDGLQTELAEIYGVFCGAEETVTVFCPAGQPSFLYRRLCEMADGESQADSSLGGALRDSLEAGAYLARWDAEAAAESLGLKEVYGQMIKCRDHTLGRISGENITGLYGELLRLSASQIDRLAECRLSYFLKYGLRAQERKPASIDPAEFGTYVHAVLEKTVSRVMELGGFRKVSLEQTQQLAEGFSKEYAQERFRQLDTQRVQYLFQRNWRELSMIVEEVWTELNNSDFLPAEFELHFGDGGKLPAVQIPGGQLMAQLTGFVDRVDIWQGEDAAYYRVVDYKTGKKDFDYCDVFNGLGLQMLLYMFALEDNGGFDSARELLPAGVQYFPARAPFVSADGVLSEEEAGAMREKLWKRRGLLLRNEEVLHAMEAEKTLGRLPCSLKKDGSLSGDLADTRQLKQLKRYLFKLLGNMVDEIASGQVAPNPYTRGTSHDACAFCPYGSVCHKEQVEGRRNYKAMTPQRFWEEVEKEVKSDG